MISNGSTQQFDKETIMAIIESIMCTEHVATAIVDGESYEILLENQLAKELFEEKLYLECQKIFSTSEVISMDCVATSSVDKTISLIRYSEVLDRALTWEISKIDWLDGKKAFLVHILDNVANKVPMSKEDLLRIHNIEEKNCLDSLTHIPNYSMFYTNAEQAILNNPDKSYAIVVFDIDKFKTINDLYGMTNGDLVLKFIADTLRDLFAEEDNYARMHSDMFAFYIPYGKKGDIIKSIEKIRKRIETNEFDFHINTSYGIFLADDLSVPINLMCDRAMIAGRTAKGNVLKFCAFYDEQFREDMLRANEIEKDMHKSLENGDFKMYLQPKYRLSNGELCGAEVLCRWLHPEKGLMPPMEFIPLFEKNGFILKLDEYMWEQACKTIRGWIDEGRQPIPLSVNISRYHIHHNDLEKVLTNLVKKYDISTSMLTLEITESLFLDKPEELNRELVKLQNLGFKLEVDDFGAGFSSLNLIRNITVDTIKIDRDFLDSEIASEKGKIVINHTIDMAKDLRLQVIAEGVETKEHVDFLKNSRCDIAQGFYFARPMPLSEFNKFSF
ncbi:MAG: bifunctional diguanylate cyclase/phosphodiesterase [Lachnospiraceae bacterium]|nr:bifunctional diguanylate cyclase/phosphodiesterase [Lachnospiraceae bacterium]